MPGHLAAESAIKKGRAVPVIRPLPNKKYDDFQLSYALDLLRGKPTVTASADKAASAAKAN